MDFAFISNFLNFERVKQDCKFISEDHLVEQKGLLSYDKQTQKIVLSGNNNMTRLDVGDFIVCNNYLMKIKTVTNQTNYKVHGLPLFDSFTGKKFFKYTLDEKETEKQYELQKKVMSALRQAEREMKSCKEFIIPNPYTENVNFALGEWASFLLSGNTIDEIRDQQLGVKKKKIDVLEWEYTENNFFPKLGCPEAWNYLSDYIDNGYFNPKTIFSLS